jgi:hypothetical protein
MVNRWMVNGKRRARTMKYLGWVLDTGLVLAILVILVLPRTADAQGVCAPRDKVLAQFAQQYGERPVSRALASNGAVLEVLASKDGSTWTLIATGPTGVTCLAASGTDWEPVEPEYGEDG